MQLYRITKKTYARDLTGEGARLYGGRWNHILTPCVYCSESRSLALLELAVNASMDTWPLQLVLVTLEIPDASLYTVSLKELPRNWKQTPAPRQTKDFGTALLHEAKHLAIRLPSAIISQEYNVILNPRHARMRDVRILQVEEFLPDARIKK